MPFPDYRSAMSQSCHDYRRLSARWRAVSRAAGIRLQTIAVADDLPVFCLKSPALSLSGGIYLSAGIHGDEPGATEGLIAWAEERQSDLAALPVVIFPCLNPWGLTMNRRSDSNGHDLNRLFHHDQHPTIVAVRKIVQLHRFCAALMLHEDYDAEGVYLYEHRKTDAAGPQLLDAAEKVIPRDPRTRIDGRRAKNGLLNPRFSPQLFEKIGHPEAIWLHLHGSARSITFETPSEFALEQRAAAHLAVINRLVELCR